MKVAGFTFVRNAIKLDFPVAEAIHSVLPLCNSFYVAAGDSEDNTIETVSKICPEKIRIIQTTWDKTLVKGGEVYADETNKAFDAIPDEFDWCFYIQCDEVLHEKFLEPVHEAMLKWKDCHTVEGLLFNYRHFYGTYDYTGDSRHWYRREVRILRNDKSIRSYRDAQGFRKNGRKLWVVPLQAEIYHYGWVRHPRDMQEKINAVKYFYGENCTEETNKTGCEKEFDYSREYDALARFTGTHPRVMEPRINRMNWQIGVDLNKLNMKPRYKILYWFEKMTGIRPFEFRNYRILKGCSF